MKINNGIQFNGPDRESGYGFQNKDNIYSSNYNGGPNAQLKKSKNDFTTFNLGDTWVKTDIHQKFTNTNDIKNRYNVNEKMNNIPLPNTNNNVAPILDRDIMNGDIGRIIANG